jgi:hypothetical protein
MTIVTKNDITYINDYDERMEILTYRNIDMKILAQYNHILDVGFVKDRKRRKLYGKKVNWLKACAKYHNIDF